jgi:hypothetical protein
MSQVVKWTVAVDVCLEFFGIDEPYGLDLVKNRKLAKIVNGKLVKTDKWTSSISNPVTAKLNE